MERGVRHSTLSGPHGRSVKVERLARAPRACEDGRRGRAEREASSLGAQSNLELAHTVSGVIADLERLPQLIGRGTEHIELSQSMHGRLLVVAKTLRGR